MFTRKKALPQPASAAARRVKCVARTDPDIVASVIVGIVIVVIVVVVIVTVVVVVVVVAVAVIVTPR